MEISGASIYLDLSFHVRGQTGSDFSFPQEANAKSGRATIADACRKKIEFAVCGQKLGKNGPGRNETEGEKSAKDARLSQTDCLRD